MNARVAILAFIICSPALALAQASSAFIASGGGGAVDAKGRRYHGEQYPGRIMPWMADRIYAASPDYPHGDRAQRHEGLGYFHLTLDLKTGLVTQVSVQQSTGFPTLDAAAIAALRRWKWRPGKWREIETPVKFRLSRYEPDVPPGSVRIPVR